MKTKGKFTVLDLFVGIGGFTLGMESTGLYKTKAFCEWDDKAAKVLLKHWPSITCFGDIKELSLPKGYCDVITGGFPCQDISYAGKGAGITGERSSHWFEYKRLISEVKPLGVIIKNVSALRNRGLETVLQDLNEIGYDAEWHCITASSFGASHQRDRIWILAYRRGKGRERLVPFQYSSTFRQGGWGGKKDLQQIYDNPFGRSDSWPEPLLCRGDVRLPGRMDRLKQVGNSVYWPIVAELGKHLAKNITNEN
jgi:DNA-cytosine methyltransferase